MEKDNRLLVQDFLLSIISENSFLHLEAEEESSGRILAIDLDSNDVIAEITNGMFSDAQDMAQGLKEAISSDYPELRLTINPQRKLT